MNLDSFVDEILDVAREHSNSDAKIIVRDRIIKDILKVVKTPIHADELKDIRQELERWYQRRRGEEDGDPVKCLEFIAAYTPELLQTAQTTLDIQDT